jgi:hypothetical protein
MQEDARARATEFDATTMIGKIHLRHPRPRELRQRRRPTMNSP